MGLKRHNERCPACKIAVKNLLAAAFGQVEANHDVDLPAHLEEYSGTDAHSHLEPIYSALQSYRGHETFVRSKKLPRVDFFIPSAQVIVEFDESQHFTRPREIALELYPQIDVFGFPVERWCTLSGDLNKRDNDPPYRDEQRAWYDTLRDFAPLLWKSGKTIRLYARDHVWCGFNHENDADVEAFRMVLSGGGLQK